LNFHGDLHCRGCGHELGIALDAERSEARCPDCAVALSSFRADAGALLSCERCGGQFVRHELLRALLEEREALGRTLPELGTVPRANPLESELRYRTCPVCPDLMNRKNFGTTSGIIVDVCAKHGVFFDAGELPRVLAFVRHGGLHRGANALRHEAQAAGGLIHPLTEFKRDPPTLLEDLSDLVDFVRHVLSGR
jgi:Zn-finger nucleic acid-binding protein